MAAQVMAPPEAVTADDALVGPLSSVDPDMAPQIFLLGKHAATEVAGARQVGPVVTGPCCSTEFEGSARRVHADPHPRSTWPGGRALGVDEAGPGHEPAAGQTFLGFDIQMIVEGLSS